MKYICLILSVTFISNLYSQNLVEERIRKIPDRKKSVYLDGGVFHNGMVKVKSKLIGIRHSYKRGAKTERIVFDFSSAKVPRIYGYFSKKKKMLTIDFMGTQVQDGLGSFGSSSFVKDVNFFPVTVETLSTEIHFKDYVSVDLFYLESPGRFVIDLKI